jgi:hypothetical protein
MLTHCMACAEDLHLSSNCWQADGYSSCSNASSAERAITSPFGVHLFPTTRPHLCCCHRVASMSSRHLSRCLVAEYHEVFATFDRDHDGRITVADLLNVSHRLGLPTNEQDLGILLGNTDIHGTPTSWQARGTPLAVSCEHALGKTTAVRPTAKRLTIDEFIEHV